MNAVTKVRLILSQLRLLFANDHALYSLRQNGVMSIGEFTYGKPKVYFWDDNTKVQIGKYCSIAADVTIVLGGEHRIDWVSTFPFMKFQDAWPEAASIEGHPRTKGDIQIGNDVWIGNGVTILSGVKIGNGAVVGAGTLVSKNIEDYCVVSGNPMRVIRTRFTETVISKLQKVAWWDWPVETVRDNLRVILAEPTEESLETMLNISRMRK